MNVWRHFYLQINSKCQHSVHEASFISLEEELGCWETSSKEPVRQLHTVIVLERRERGWNKTHILLH